MPIKNIIIPTWPNWYGLRMRARSTLDTNATSIEAICPKRDQAVPCKSVLPTDFIITNTAGAYFFFFLFVIYYSIEKLLLGDIVTQRLTYYFLSSV
jgi:hypothetical protein